MKIGNLIKENGEHKSMIRSFPTGPMKKSLKQKYSDFLEHVRDTYGQDIVDILCKHPRLANKTNEEKLAMIKNANLF